MIAQAGRLCPLAVQTVTRTARTASDKQVYKLWERVMHGLHQLDRSPDEAIAELRGCLPDAMKLKFQLIPELARIMELARPPDAAGRREETEGSSRPGSPP